MTAIPRWLRWLTSRWYDADAAEARERHSLALTAKVDRQLDRIEGVRASYTEIGQRLDR